MDLIVTPLPAQDAAIGRTLWLLEDTRRRTLEVLKNVTSEALDRTPSQSDDSIGSLLYHVAAIELSWLYDEVLVEAYPTWAESLFPIDARDNKGRLSLVAGQTLDQHLHRLATVRSETQRVFAAMTIEDFRRVRSLPQYNVSPEWVLHHLMQHEAEHRSQIAGLA